MLGRALALACCGLLHGARAQAQASEIYTHLDRVAVSSSATPAGDGLLPTAIAEADIALQHARLAMEDSLSLTGMRRHAGHVMHALDPAVVSGAGPGLGFGVRQAALEGARHLELVGAADSLPENVARHTTYMIPSLADAARWSDEAVALGQDIQTARSVTAALPLVRRLVLLCHAIRWGRDADRNGIVGWQEGEGGLAQAEYHMRALRRGEGLVSGRP